MTPLLLFLFLLLLKSLAVLALAGLTLLALRRASAASRHLVCLLTLAALLALPLFSQSRFSLPVAVPTALPDAPADLTPRPLLKQGEGAGLGQGAGTGPNEAETNAEPPKPAPPYGLFPNPSRFGRGGEERDGVGSFLLPLWLLGVLLAALRPLLGLWGIGQINKRSRPETAPAVLTLTEGCAAALGLFRPPAVRRGDVPVPMTWGLRRPVVLLPEAADAWPEGRLEAVLLHELAHIRRRDWAAHRLADLACALYWFHPLVWLTARRLRAEGEIACDDLVLSSGVSAPDYARHLLDIARALSSAPAVPTGTLAMARTAQVEGRITMILKPAQNRRALTSRALLLALLPATAAVGIIAALRPAAQADAKAAPASHSLGKRTLANGTTVGFVEKPPVLGGPLTLALHIMPQTQPQNIWATPPLPTVADLYLNSGGGRYALKPGIIWGSDLDSGIITTEAPGPTAGERSNGTMLYAVSQNLPATVHTLDVGVAAGPWTLSVDGPNKIGKVYLAQPSGQVIWTLAGHKHQDGALLMVSDHFHTLSPLPSQNDTQTKMNDIENYQRVVYAVDSAGRILADLRGGSMATPDADEPGSIGGEYQTFKVMQTVHVSSALLRRTAKFRLVARPYEWTKLTVGSQSAKR